MRNQRFFLLAVFAAFCAITLHLTALKQISHCLHHRALAIRLGEADRATARAEAKLYAARGQLAGFVGLVLAVSSAVLGVISARRREPARRVAIFGLLLCYFLLQFLMV